MFPQKLGALKLQTETQEKKGETLMDSCKFALWAIVVYFHFQVSAKIGKQLVIILGPT